MVSCSCWLLAYYGGVRDSLRQFKSEIFQALANPTRIAVLDELRRGELTVGGIMARIDVEQSNLSQHLAVMRARQIVMARKSGNQVFYSVRDPLIFRVLDLMRHYFQNQVSQSIGLLEENGGSRSKKIRSR